MNLRQIKANNNLLFLNLLLISLILFVGEFTPCKADNSNRNRPHIHNGVLPQYTPGPFKELVLERNDEKSLEDGKSVMKSIPSSTGEKGGRAICVQDIEASKDAVWNQILNFNSYVGKVDKLKECKHYFMKRNPDGTTTIKAKFVVGVLPGYKYEYYCDHLFRPKDNSLTWSLDYEKLSDFNDVAGHWHIEEHPSKQGVTRVFYGADVKLPEAVPGPVVNFVKKSALRQATSWVKRESESKPTAPFPAEFGTLAYK